MPIYLVLGQAIGLLVGQKKSGSYRIVQLIQRNISVTVKAIGRVTCNFIEQSEIFMQKVHCFVSNQHNLIVGVEESKKVGYICLFAIGPFFVKVFCCCLICSGKLKN